MGTFHLLRDTHMCVLEYFPVRWIHGILGTIFRTCLRNVGDNDFADGLAFCRSLSLYLSLSLSSPIWVWNVRPVADCCCWLKQIAAKKSCGTLLSTMKIDLMPRDKVYEKNENFRLPTNSFLVIETILVFGTGQSLHSFGLCSIATDVVYGFPVESLGSEIPST